MEAHIIYLQVMPFVFIVCIVGLRRLTDYQIEKFPRGAIVLLLTAFWPIVTLFGLLALLSNIIGYFARYTGEHKSFYTTEELAEMGA
jgi:hypothetical protein